MKCQVSVGVKLRRRLCCPQDGESMGKQKLITQVSTAGFCGIYGRRKLQGTLAKNLHLALCSSGGGRSQEQSVGVAEMEMRYCVRVGGWDRRGCEATMLAGDRAVTWRGSVVDYYYHSITYHGACCRCLGVLACVGILSSTGTCLNTCK